MDAVPKSPLVALYLDAWISDEEGAPIPGDVLEVRLHDFDGDLAAAPEGSALRIAEFRNIRCGTALGIPARSYRIRIVGIREMKDGGKTLYVAEADRGTADYGAIPSS